MTHGKKEVPDKIAKYLPHLVSKGAHITKMASLEKFCLRWNDFGGSVSRSFASIRESNQFFDCTLTTDDDEEYSDNLRAHKVILAASSEFFKKILTKESMCAHPNPLIYLRGISAQELKYILDFIYHGEVNVAQDELDKFLEVAETLKIQGLTQNFKTRKRPLPTPITPLPFQSEPIKKPKMNLARTPSPSMTKMEPKDYVLTESNPSLNISSEDFEYNIRENNDYATVDEDISEHFEEDNDGDDDNQNSGARAGHESGKNSDPKPGHKGKHLSETEKITLVNLIKTLDTEHIFRKRLGKSRGKDLRNDHETNEKRKELWSQILPAFNEICGLECDLDKLRRTLGRIKRTTHWKSHSLLYEDLVE